MHSSRHGLFADSPEVEGSNKPARLASLWSALSRPRPHRAVDLALGAFLLVGIALGIASWSPILAVALIVAVAGVYLVSLLRQEGERRVRSAMLPRASASRMRDAIDALDGILVEAPAIPLTGWVRVDPAEVTPLLDAVRAGAGGTASSDQAEKLAAVVLGDRPVPFTSQVRVDRKRARRLLAGLRSGFG
jgi:hypothetical protein